MSPRRSLASLVLRPQVAAGLRDPNTMTEAELTMLPNYSAAIAKATVAARPFLSIADFDKFLGAQGLNPEQRTAVYNRAFVHVNLNTASEAEIMLIPNVGKRMAHEFEEYRPWKAWAQFDKEIGKYVDAKEVARLKQYTFIPLRLNTASEADFMTIPGVGKRMAHEFEDTAPGRRRPSSRRRSGSTWTKKKSRACGAT